ncbi:hypothetical protein SAMN06265222_101641 [Neorhodopirellula lusitana]|uniref:Uncharacterized protein n=1 Tax=Neorhodopirellula lusitana TaxID=445327 RepID=A0ABY1PR78_9BACT|nr:hypothetical protein [Neorhodopirellula lusitana]SMP41729.1 hypothetical protein SAMN06265222_101641 [Neorhodopirellula lusitana]
MSMNQGQRSDSVSSNPTPATGRLPGGKTAAGYRVVHVAVPEPVFNHAKAQAFLAGKTWTEHITDLLEGSAK